jgi:hypothetical protein
MSRWDRNKRRQVAIVALAAAALAAIPAAFVAASDTFTDVPTSAYYHNAVNAIYDAGITSGCVVSPPKYCPNSAVTRGQMAVFLNKLGALSPDTSPVVDALTDQGTMVLKFEQGFTLAGGAPTECEAGTPMPGPLSFGGNLTVQHQLYSAPNGVNTAQINVQLHDNADPSNGYEVCFAKLGGGNLTGGTYHTFGTFTAFLGEGLFASGASASQAREAGHAAASSKR